MSTFEPKELRRILGDHHSLLSTRRVLESMIALILFVFTCMFMLVILGAGYWSGLLLLVPAAGFLMRLFVIHDDWMRELRAKRGHYSRR